MIQNEQTLEAGMSFIPKLLETFHGFPVWESAGCAMLSDPKGFQQLQQQT
jgi:hypothetical protein